MKNLPLGLFIGYLIFLSAKSFKVPVTSQESVILAILSFIVLAQIVSRHLHRYNYRKFLIKNKELDLQIPEEKDPEIAQLERDATIESLKLKKFITEQEFSKREISRTIEKNGGLRF